MLSYMRKHQRSFLIYLLFGIIIIVFVAYFGPQSEGCFTSAVYAARVNGEIIGEDEFNFTYSNRFRQLQDQDRTFNSETAARMKLRDHVMDQLVNTRLLAQEARRRGIRVSDEELRRSILEMPIFQVNGKFDETLYERFVNNYFRTSLQAFEERQKTMLLAQKMLDTLAASVQVSDLDTRTRYESDNNRANLYFIRVDPEKFKSQTSAQPSEIDDIISNRYKEVEDYYQKHQYQYKTAEQVRARHILAKIDENAKEADARKKIEAVQDELNKGGDFAELAKKQSDCPSSAQGGDLGFFGRGQMDKAFEDAAFALEPGRTSGIVKSSFGFHLIQLEEKKPASEKAIKDVEREIAEKVLLEEKAARLARAKADELFARIQAGSKIEDLAPLAEEPGAAAQPAKKKEDPLGLKVEQTGAFGREGMGYVPRIGMSEELLKDAFSLTLDKPNGNKVYEVSNRYFIVALKERRLPDMERFPSEKARLMESLRAAKVDSVIEEWLSAQQQKSKVDVNSDYLVYRDSD